MKKIKVVVDTQIFIRSWFNDKYVCCDTIMTLLDTDKLKLVSSRDTIGELFYVTKNFATHIFKNDKDTQLKYMNMVAELFLDSVSINTKKTECQEIKDKSDMMFLKSAIESNADYLISDDKKSGLHGVELDGTKIVTSEDFIKIYDGLCAG